MWEALGKILTSPYTWMILLFLCVIVFLIVITAKLGLLEIDSGKVKIGNKDSERKIIQQQIEWSYLFIMSLRNKFDIENMYGGYLAKYILERVFDEVVEWITLNHIKDSESYILVKQKKIESIVYNEDIPDKFKSPEFKERMDRWVEEVIRGILQIRKAYK